MRLPTAIFLAVVSLGFLLTSSGSVAPDDVGERLRLPVIPDWVRYPAIRNRILSPSSGVYDPESDPDCVPRQSYPVTDDHVAIYYDTARSVTEVYAGDALNERVVRTDIEPSLASSTAPLPIPWGVAWTAADLDNDGTLELVLQRGDEGLGGNGYLDIVSAPDWTLRAHFVLPGMKVVMHAVAVNVDTDFYQEVFLTPKALDGSGFAVIVDYDPVADSFYIRSQVSGPVDMGGPTAIADFDSDGSMEFILGAGPGFALFEWQDTLLAYIGIVGDSTPDYTRLSAVICKPRLDGLTYALVGQVLQQAGFHHLLLKPVGDNLFQVEHDFAETTGATGATACGAADTDCDGLDELFVHPYPTDRTWEWDDASCSYVLRCTWPEASTMGGLRYWHRLDVDQDGTEDALGANSVGSRLYLFSGILPVSCDTNPRCLPCACPCYSDPNCDSVRSSVVDVVQTVNVAFRSEESIIDAACPFARTDADCDGATDVVDVVKVVDVAFRGAGASDQFCNPCL